MVEFCDLLYGTVKLPDWIVPFIKLPECLRLRGVRLSNVDSYQFKDFNGASRWEHSIAVAYLALRCAERRSLGEAERIQLAISGLLHDVATPPFGHTAEYVLESFDHEFESKRVLNARSGKDFLPESPIYAASLPRFQKVCKVAARRIGLPIDCDEIARMIIGEGELGFLIHGTIDLDNADNVLRACLHLGVEVDRELPLRISDWLACQKYRPIDLENISDECVQAWLEYRRELYQRFYTSSEEELGRQAFLQHLMRRAVDAGFPRSSLIWSTDDALLASIENFEAKESARSTKSLRELVQRYRLLEAPNKIAHVDVEGEELLRTLCLPHVVGWIESQLTCRTLEPMVMVSARRHTGQDPDSLFPSFPASLLVFKLGQVIKRELLPQWMQEEIPDHLPGRALVTKISQVLHKRVAVWVKEKPWLDFTVERKAQVIGKLRHVQDWSFRFTWNENVHPYPSTFVYAIPANLINALGLRGELIVDPFGGVGQTALEAVKYEGRAVSADSNRFASLCARSRLTFLTVAQRENMRAITQELVCQHIPAEPPSVDGIDKWFHPQTLQELGRIWAFIQRRRDSVVRQFLSVCFSAILCSCTARRGKHHTYFADNTALSAGETEPPYCDAIGLFIGKVGNNLDIVERLYAFIERQGRDPCHELSRARVLQLDASRATLADYGVDPGSVAAIITSPPYLCMADYTFGLRLSYYWLAPGAMQDDFATEIGARRNRRRVKEVTESYFDGIKRFAANAATMLRPGGFLGTVYGAPAARAFESIDVMQMFDSILHEQGLELLWQDQRSIQWRRGYGAIKSERVAVHVLAR